MQVTPWHRWSSTLVAISALGTLLAGVTLMLDGWFDALALYVACVLLLALMLCHIAGQQAQPRPVAFARDGRADSGSRPAGLVLTAAPGTWAGADRTAIPVAFGNAPPTD